MTYEYINVSGAKPKLCNLPPSMTKLKVLKGNKEKPSGDASARRTNKGLGSCQIDSMLRANKTERERMEV